MGIISGLLSKLGLEDLAGRREVLNVFLLDDDTLRHEWFARQFKGDRLDVAVDPARAVELLSANRYDLIFLDHDLLPEHYHSDESDDERTGYAVARWLSERPAAQAASTVVIHTRNADGALRMVKLLRAQGREAEHVPFHQLETRVKHLRKHRG